MIYLTGDLHGDKGQIKKYIEVLSACTKEDILIVAGDFGLPWYSRVFPHHFEDDKLLDLLRNAPFTTCFVDGNHENFTLLYRFPIIQKWGGRVHDLDGIYHLMRGEFYTMEGHSIFAFGGATSVDKMYRTPEFSWWELENATQEEKDYALQNLENHDFNVDYVITHQAPEQFLDMYLHTMFDGIELTCPTQAFLTSIESKLNYKKWYFGHYHDSRNNQKARLLFNDIVLLGE